MWDFSKMFLKKLNGLFHPLSDLTMNRNYSFLKRVEK